MYLFRLFYHCSATPQAKTELSDRCLLLRLEDVCVPELAAFCVLSASHHCRGTQGDDLVLRQELQCSMCALKSFQAMAVTVAQSLCVFVPPLFFLFFFWGGGGGTGLATVLPSLCVPHFRPGTDFPALCMLVPQSFGTGHCSSHIICVPYSFWTGHCSSLIVCVSCSFWTGHCSSLIVLCPVFLLNGRCSSHIICVPYSF